MVKLINNVPCKYVSLFEPDMEFILLHKILDNKGYRQYYLKNKNNGKYKILDNGAYELGSSLDDKKLIEWAIKLNVNEIIAPDVFKDMELTLNRLGKFVESCPKHFKIQAVPQGKDNKDLFSCLDMMLNFYDVDVIGFNKLWDRHSLLFEEVIKRTYSMGKEVHLLGVNCLHDWTNVLKNPFVRSADSRVLSKIVSGREDTWEVILNDKQLEILKRLHKEVMLWQS